MWHFLKAVFRVGGHIIVAYFSWIRKFAKKVAKIPFEYRYKKLRKLLIRLSKALDIEHHVEGLENVPKENCFFVCNHVLGELFGCTLALEWASPVSGVGFPGGSDGKESACSVGDPGLIPGLGRSPGEGNGYPLQYSCLENFIDRGAW